MVQHLEYAPKAYPIAVFVERVLLPIGQRTTGPGLAHTIQERKRLIVLDVGGDPEGHPGIVRPRDDGAVNPGKVGDAIRG